MSSMSVSLALIASSSWMRIRTWAGFVEPLRKSFLKGITVDRHPFVACGVVNHLGSFEMRFYR